METAMGVFFCGKNQVVTSASAVGGNGEKERTSFLGSWQRQRPDHGEPDVFREEGSEKWQKQDRERGERRS